MSLKKEFKKDDVQRMRNLIQGKHGDKTRLSSGYSKKRIDYKEGDIWEEDDKIWTIKGGIKQNVTKLDGAKELHRLPLFCPECEGIMNNRNDKDFYRIHKKCFECVVLMEVKLKKEGKWEEYEKQIHNNEIDNKIKEVKNWIEEVKEESNESFISEDGHVENWLGQIDEEKVDIYEQEIITFLQNKKK